LGGLCVAVEDDIVFDHCVQDDLLRVFFPLLLPGEKAITPRTTIDIFVFAARH
jgi:hypothetical protein